MSPDRVPSLFPERPIRPLPKRKLREKLSPGGFQTIEYPPATVNSIPLFCYPAHTAGGPPHDLSKATREHNKQSNGTSDSQDSPDLYRHEPLPVSSTAEIQLQLNPHEGIKYNVPLDPGATLGQNISFASSIDGFDSLENTNNKKKRKIPSASDTTLRGSLFASTGSVEILELSGMDDGNQATTSALAVSGSLSMHNEGISGSGRGRLGSTLHTRSPLRTLSDGNNSWSSRPLKTGLHHTGNGYGTGGIISNAIADAERLGPSGQENVDSLLRQHSESGKTTPIASKFTFTCGSQMAGTASWPDTSPASGSADCLQTEPMAHGKSIPAAASSNSKAAAEEPKRPRTNSRRQLERDIVLAARNRRQAAVDAYHHDPPRLENIWICEFCEYERIFGSPPKALIRAYELKDRRVRQEEADRRRLLEKAKAKSRKGRKGNKMTKVAQLGTQSQDQISVGRAVTEPTLMAASDSHSTQSEDGYEEKVEDYQSQDPPDILGLHGKGSAPEDFPVP